MKLLTLNTHSLSEYNYSHKLQVFAESISRMLPDIIALQEVNQTRTSPVVMECRYDNFTSVVKEDNHALNVVKLLKGMGVTYHWCYLPVKVGYDIYDEGLAVLSRYPITSAMEIVLSQNDDYHNWRTRKALLVRTENKNIGTVCNVHMGWWEDEDEPFAEQWRRLVASIPEGTLWLMGDFNAPDTRKGEGYDLIRLYGFLDLYRCVSDDEGATVPGSIDGWRSSAPKRIDYIWCNRSPIVHSCEVCFDKNPVSDHYGVFAKVEQVNRLPRSSGVLMPIFSLPSSGGIGCFDESAYKFVDFLADSGQTWWQILPLGSTGYGDSPYQSFSSFGGNPYYISLNTLVEEGLLDDSDIEVSPVERIDYGKLYDSRYKVLRKAYSAWNRDRGYECFVRDNAYWLDDYSLFMAVKDYYGGKSWYEWDEGIKYCKDSAIDHYRKLLWDDIGFYNFVQYKFHTQWHKLKKYANAKGVEIIGDIPIYVAYDSADCWANGELFQLDSSKKPISVAGCPPDGFSATGQLWGNPLYDWEEHRDSGFCWWKQRMAYSATLYDVIRLDHFRGFDEYYAIPGGAEDAVGGRWERGPGMALFDALAESGIFCRYIAEDLGFVTEGVRTMLEECGFPGMKILQFGFDSRDSSSNDHIPHNYVSSSVVYTGTHDNHTLKGWYSSIDHDEQLRIKNYLGVDTDEAVCSAMIRCAMASVCDVCIIPIQDWLELGDDARVNTPGTFGGNWTWRIDSIDTLDSIVADIKNMTSLYGRYNQKLQH